MATVHHFGPAVDDIGGMSSVIRVIREHSVGGEEVRAHSTWRSGAPGASLGLAALAAAGLMRVPAGSVVHVHLSERGSFLREGAIALLARARRLPTILTIHGADFLRFAGEHPRLAKLVLRRAQAVICLDPAVCRLVGRWAPRARVEIVPNPVPPDEHPTSAADTEEIVLFAGEIGRRKGADVLAEAWRSVAGERPAARCIMVGPPGDFQVPAAERLEVRAAVPAAEVRRLLRQARLVVLPSRAEGMPMILTEAMSCGRPFVSTPVGGVAELAAGGLLVEVGDPDQLARQVSALLADPARARELGERGRSEWRRNRSTAAVDRRLRGVYAFARGL